jgi:hypothetical protein
MKDTISFEAYLASPYRSIKHSTYFEVYDKLFLSFRNKEIIFVEIGVLDGGSLFMWRNFFGPEARIIGIDLNPEAKKWEKYGFEIYIGNQSNENFWIKFIDKVGQVDLILDDGGHTYEQQIITTEKLLSIINDNGMLVVEDTHTSYMNGFGPRRYTFVKYAKRMVDRCNLRFARLNPAAAENRVWSIQVFESIIVFHINRKATNLASIRTENLGIENGELDFRNQDKFFFSAIRTMLLKVVFLRKFKSIKFLYQIFINFILSIGVRGRLKKYF